MSFFDLSHLNLHQQVLSVRTKQLEAIATNISNESTPHYRAKQVDFEAQIQAYNQSQPLTRSHPKHIAITQENIAHVGGDEPQWMSTNLDGNNVDSLKERMAFSKAALHYQATQQLAHSSIQSARSAIKGVK